MSIYKGQKIPLTTTFTDASGAVDITAGTIAYNYWIPNNNTVSPTGSVVGSIVSAPAGTASGEIPAATNIYSGIWKVQAVLTLSGDNWPAVTTTFSVLDRGK